MFGTSSYILFIKTHHHAIQSTHVKMVVNVPTMDTVLVVGVEMVMVVDSVKREFLVHHTVRAILFLLLSKLYFTSTMFLCYHFFHGFKIVKRI